MTPVELFRCFKHLREATGNNDGARVEGVQTWGGGKKGDSWCCWLFTMVLDMYFKGYLGKESPIPREGACEAVHKLVQTKNWFTEIPEIGDGYLFINAEGLAHHIGMVTEKLAKGFKGIAGNTSEDGKSSNGTGCFEHEFLYNYNKIVFFKYPR